MRTVKICLISIVILVAVVSLWVGAFAFRRVTEHRTGGQRSPMASSTTAREATRAPLRFDYKWKKDQFGVLMVADFTFHNDSARPIKDITITCTHSAPSGTEIDSNTRTIYEIVPARSSRVIKDFDMGFIHSQATSTTCKIDDYVM